MASQPGKFSQGNRPPNRRFQRQDTVEERPVDSVQYDPQLLESVKVAVLSGNVVDVQRAVLGLQGRGTSINIRIEGRSLLHHVLSLAEEQVGLQQRTEIASYLLAQGIEVNALDEGRRTPLFLAAERGLAPIVELLLEHGADPHVPDRFRNYPLHVACRPTMVQCPAPTQPPDLLRVPLSFVSSQIEDLVYDRGIAQYIKKKMETDLRKYLLTITRLLMDSVQVDRDIRKHILQLYLPTTNPLEQYHSIYQKVYKKLGDLFPTFYTRDNIFKLDDTAERPEHFLLDTFTPPSTLVRERLKTLNARKDSDISFFKSFRPDVTTARNKTRAELFKALKNIIQMLFIEMLTEHMDNDSRNKSTFQQYQKYLGALGTGVPTPQDEEYLQTPTVEAMDEWQREVLELPVATLKRLFAALGAQFEVPIEFRPSNPTILRNMKDPDPADDPPVKGTFTVYALFYFLNIFFQNKKEKIFEYAVNLYSYRAYADLQRLSAYVPPAPLTGTMYQEIGQDLKSFYKNSPYTQIAVRYEVPGEERGLLKEIVQQQESARKNDEDIFLNIVPLESVSLDLLRDFRVRYENFMVDAQRFAFYTIAANIIFEETTSIAFPTDNDWQTFDVHTSDDIFRIASEYFRRHSEQNGVLDLPQTSTKRSADALPLNYERLLQLLKHQWLFEFHQRTPYILDKNKEDSFNIRQQIILSMRMLEQLTELMKHHLDLQRPAIAYIICFRIYRDLIKLYTSDKIKKEIQLFLFRKLKKYSIDSSNRVIESTDAGPEGGPEEPSASEKRFVESRKLQQSPHPRLVDRANDYVEQLRVRFEALQESNVFMERTDPRSQVEFLLKSQRSSGVSAEQKTFRVDQRVSSSICYSIGNSAAELLLDRGANVNVQNDRNESPLFDVIRTFNLPLFLELLRRGAGVLTLFNIFKEKPLDVICLQFEKHARYGHLQLQTSLVICEQLHKVSATYTLSFVEPLVQKVLLGVWRPLYALKNALDPLLLTQDLKAARKDPANALDRTYFDVLPRFPDEAYARLRTRAPPEDAPAAMRELHECVRQVRTYFRGGVAYLDDVRELRELAARAIATHSRIYRYVELQRESVGAYDQLVYNFQAMLEDLFRDEVPVRPPSELYTFVLEDVVLAEVEPQARDRIRTTVAEQLNTLEASLKKRALQQSVEPTASLNAAELVGHLFGLLQGMPEMQGRSLVPAQNFVTACYETTINALRDLYFSLGSAHLKMHILLEMLHDALEHVEKQISA